MKNIPMRTLSHGDVFFVGYKENTQTGWAIVEAMNRDHAKQIVPWFLRDKARIVKLVKFEVADPEHDKDRSK